MSKEQEATPPAVFEYFDAEKMKRKGNRAGVAGGLGVASYFLVRWLIELLGAWQPDIGKLIDESFVSWIAELVSGAVAAYVAKVAFQIENKVKHSNLPAAPEQ